MKKNIILTIATLCILSTIEGKKEEKDITTKTYKRQPSIPQRPPINDYWYIQRENEERLEQSATPCWKLQGKTFRNDKPVAIGYLPDSQVVRNINIQASITLECKNKAGKKIPAPQPTIHQVGRFRDYSQIYTYDFRHMTESVTCYLTVEETLTGGYYGGGEEVERWKDKKGKRYWKVIEKGGKITATTYTFKVIPTKSTVSSGKK